MSRLTAQEAARRRALRDKVKRRGNYRPGNSVHWIQAKKAAETLAQAGRGRIVGITHRGIHVLVNDEVRRYGGNRDEVRRRVAEDGPDVRIQDRWALLWIANHPISVRRTDQHHT